MQFILKISMYLVAGYLVFMALGLIISIFGRFIAVILGIFVLSFFIYALSYQTEFGNFTALLLVSVSCIGLFELARKCLAWINKKRKKASSTPESY